MEQLEQYLLDKLRYMQEEKEKQPVHPHWVTRTELLSSIDKDMRTVLNKLYQEKTINVHITTHAPILDYVELVK